MPEEKMVPVAAPERVEDLKEFAARLVGLCNQFQFDLDANANHTDGVIFVTDRTRQPSADWPWVAHFSGVDESGMWQIGDPDGSGSGIVISEMPESERPE